MKVIMSAIDMAKDFLNTIWKFTFRSLVITRVKGVLLQPPMRQFPMRRKAREFAFNT